MLVGGVPAVERMEVSFTFPHPLLASLLMPPTFLPTRKLGSSSYRYYGRGIVNSLLDYRGT